MRLATIRTAESVRVGLGVRAGLGECRNICVEEKP
jgi:hypothetical protein